MYFPEQLHSISLFVSFTVWILWFIPTGYPKSAML
jgi:hypothetical protein